MTIALPDVIDQLVGIAPGSPLDAIRAARLQARENAQASFMALFEPAEPGDVSRIERRALALFVSGLHRAGPTEDFYAAGIEDEAAPELLIAAVQAASRAGRSEGPVGSYPDGPLAGESVPAKAWTVPGELREVLGERLVALFGHAHMLVFRPREADAASLDDLLRAGWTTTGIVTTSQIVAYLAFQIRVVAGLKVLADYPAAA